jgi:cytoskeleton protein RodZ
MTGGSSVADDNLQTQPGETAGQIIRTAREKRGLHIAALAASLKVPQKKLEALEADRYEDLPDVAFTRALAQSVCRVLKVDPQPVLARLPAPREHPRLAQVSNSMRTPFSQPAHEFKLGSFLSSPMVWATFLIAGAAAAVAFMPQEWLHQARNQFDVWVGQGTPPAVASTAPVAAAQTSKPVETALATPAAPVAAAASEPVVSVPAVVETVHSAPPPSLPAAMGASAAGLPAEPPAGLLLLRATAPSWVDVQDARGQSLLSRTLQAGETVGLDGSLPLRVKVGNAAGTEVYFRGQAVDLAASTRENTARLQLK